jgi:cell division protease FtsH
MISLAGKAATEVILNEIDMGSRSDLRSANDKMRKLLDNVAAFDFHTWCHGPETSNRVFDHLDDAVGTELTRYYIKTKQMLGKNRAFLEAIIEKLIEKKTLSYKDIAPIREKFIQDGNKAA